MEKSSYHTLLSRQCQSSEIGNLALALSRAQGAMSLARRDAVNGMYDSSYADLGSCLESCRKPLSDNCLAVVQMLGTGNDGRIHVFTKLIHGQSGEWIESDYPIVCPAENPHAIGSAITYARRYSLCALVGVAAEDDDAQEAMNAYTTKEVISQKNGVSNVGAGKERCVLATAKQIQTISEMARERGVDVEQVAQDVLGGYEGLLENLSKVDASRLISWMSQQKTDSFEKAV